MDVLIHDFEVMGTVFRFTFAEAEGERVGTLLPLAQQILVEADQTFSTYKPDSEVSLIREGNLSMGDASFDVKQVFRDCANWNTKTEGGFDSFDPNGKWDPSGLVKAWAAQSAAEYLVANGVIDFSLNAGGDIYLGPKANPLLKRVGIAKPVSIAVTGLQAGWVIDLSDTGYRAVATSGSAERGDHIWGKTSDLLQVTVVGRELISADVWATSLFAKGPALLPAMSEMGLEALLIFSDGTTYKTDGFAKLELELSNVKEV